MNAFDDLKAKSINECPWRVCYDSQSANKLVDHDLVTVDLMLTTMFVGKKTDPTQFTVLLSNCFSCF